MRCGYSRKKYLIYLIFPLYLHRTRQNQTLNEKKTKKKGRGRAKRIELGKDLNQNINLLLKSDLEKILGTGILLAVN